ncbi:hypothetical protein UFOVP201_11 [uncultured Caudovirales phage]|uniref:Uncharacterized protein n=1 Tax=uncultured Caudovirales phage TaxID=2100421 RepID=A0A6J7WM59_9CAUD|nr:hypothetical protein UFOVP201_11 [uncultured Caudovirales phage]
MTEKEAMFLLANTALGLEKTASILEQMSKDLERSHEKHATKLETIAEQMVAHADVIRQASGLNELIDENIRAIKNNPTTRS